MLSRRTRLLLLLLLKGPESVSGLQQTLFRPACRPFHRVRTVPCMSGATDAFDETSYERDRLAKDAEAMGAMQKEAEKEFASLRTPWKWVLRKHVWDHMEENDIARQPRPVHHRIPNFDGAEVAARALGELPEFMQARCVKVNPDTPQRPVRELVLARDKMLLTPQPRLRTGFFSTLTVADNLPEKKPISSSSVMPIPPCICSASFDTSSKVFPA